MNGILQNACRSYRMHVVAHRLRKFGFEPSINKLPTEDLEVLATLLYPHQQQAVMREIALRTSNSGHCVIHGPVYTRMEG